MSLLKHHLYEILSSIQEQQGCYFDALESHKNYSDNLLSIFACKVNNNLLDFQKKYDYRKSPGFT